MLLQDLADLDGVARDVASVDAVLFPGKTLHATLVALAEQLANKAFDGVSNHQDLLSASLVNRFRTGQRRCCAMASRLGLGLVTIGCVTTSSSGKSLMESL